jgi:prolipoprotein diacylglyceryltransferase
LALFAFGRFFLEFFRGASPTFGPLTVAQWVCVEVVVSVAVVHLVLTVSERMRARA